jgi:hypothetical protein
VTTISGESAIHIAASHGKHEICRLIAEQRGVDLFAKDFQGKTPIESALASGYKELALKITAWSCVDFKLKVTHRCFVQFPIYELVLNRNFLIFRNC